MRFVGSVFGMIAKLAIAIIVTFFFFIIIPLTHSLFGTSNKNSVVSSGPKIIAELVRPPKQEEQKQNQARIRQVNTSKGNKSTNRMDIKFSPDLEVGSGDGVALAQEGQMEAIVFNEGETDEDAIPIYTPQLKYPERLRDLGIQGILDVTLTIDISGKVRTITVVSSPHPLLSKEAQNVMITWKFKPATNDGIPVIQNVKQIIEYKLD